MAEQEQRGSLNGDLAWLYQRIGRQRELLLDSLPYLKEVISGVIPQVNNDADEFFSLLGLSQPPPLLQTSIHYFYNRERFRQELDREDEAVAFARNGSINISLPDIQDELRDIDEALKLDVEFDLPTSYVFLFLANTYIQHLLHHENLHRIHELSRSKVPQNVQENVVKFALVFFEEIQNKDEEPENPTGELQLKTIYSRLIDADEKGDLQVFQEGAMLVMVSGGGIITAFGRSINEILIDYFAQQVVVNKLRARGISLDDVAGKFLDIRNTLRIDEDHEDVARERIDQFLEQSGRDQTVGAFLTSHFFDTLLGEVSEQEIMRFFHLTCGDLNFFSTPLPR